MQRQVRAKSRHCTDCHCCGRSRHMTAAGRAGCHMAMGLQRAILGLVSGEARRGPGR